MKKKFSLLAAIQQDIANRSYSQETLAVIARGKELSLRDHNSPVGRLVLPWEERDLTKADNAGLVGTDVIDLITPLRNTLLTVTAGCTLLSGLTGDTEIPDSSSFSAEWADEIEDNNNDASCTFEGVKMTPKRLTASFDISRTLLLETSPSVETLLRKFLIDAVSDKLEATLFGKNAHANKTPDGLYTGISDELLAFKGLASWGNVLSFESKLDDNKAPRDTRAYITNGAGAKILKQTPKIAGQASFLLQDGKMNEYPVLVSNNVASGLATAEDEQGLIFANWSDLIIGLFGSLDILVDPFTQSKAGKVRLTVNSYWDIVKRRTSSFAIGSLK